MKTHPRFAAPVVALIAIVALGLAACGPVASPPAGERQTASPSVSPRPSASPGVAAATPLDVTEAYTSERHGYSISYPAGWMSRPATEPWMTGIPDLMSAAGDVFYDPASDEGHLWIVVASQPIGNSTPDAWVAEHLNECAETEPTAVDGASGLIGTDDCNMAAVTTDGRGYLIWLYTSDDEASLSATYDRAWFEEVLATAQLRPEDAVDVAPSASP